MQDPTYRRGYTAAIAQQLGVVQQQLDHHADRIAPDQLARRAIRLAAGHAGQADEVLTHLAGHDDPAASELQRAHAAARLTEMTEPDPRPRPEDPTARGQQAGAEVIRWLDDLVPPWPADHKMGMAGQVFHGPRTGGTAVDFQFIELSGTLPVGALMTALKTVAAQGGPAAETIRQILIEHEIPENAAFRRRQRAIDARIEAGIQALNANQ